MGFGLSWRPKMIWAALLLFDLVVLPFAVEGIHAADTDMFYHLASGRYMVEHRQLLDREVFSFTSGEGPWTNYHWLFQYVLYQLYRLGGFAALIGFRAGVVLLTVHLIFYLIYRRAQQDPLITLAFSLAAFALYIPRAVNIRSHLMSYLLLAACMVLLERFRRRPGSLEPWLPILCGLWANLHGVEYPVPLGAVAIYCFTALIPSFHRSLGAIVRDREIMRWPLLLLACAVAFLVSPYGVKLLHTPLMARDQEVMSFIAEMTPYSWHAVLFLHPQGDLYSPVTFHYLLLASLFVLPVWVSRRDWRALLFYLLGTALVFQRARFFAEFAILVPPFMAEAVSRLRAEPGRRRWPISLILAAFIAYIGSTAVLTVHSHYRRGYFDPISASAYPVGAARFLRAEGLTGNLLSRPGDAGYIEWALYPEIRVAMDMRTPEPFDAQIYWRIRSADNPAQFRNLQAQWPIDFVLLRRGPSSIPIAHDPGLGFVPTYADDRFILLTHSRKLAGGHEHLALRQFNPFDPALRYVAALADASSREELRAETQRLLRIWPANHLAHRTALALSLRAGENGAARAQALALMAEFPREAAYPYYAGLALKATHENLPRALEWFEEALALDPDFEPAYPALAETALQLARYRTGLLVMERYLRRRAYDLPAPDYLLLGILRDHVGDPAGAAAAYERALWLTSEESPLRPYVESNLGGAYVELDRPESALPLLDAALKRVSPFPEAEFNRASAWAKLGRAEAARSVFRRLAVEPSVPPLVKARALSRLRQELPQ